MTFAELKKKLNECNKGFEEIDGLKIEAYVPIKKKYGIVPQTFPDVIEIKDGYATINRMMYEVELYHLLVALYTDIQIDGDFTDESCDILIKNNFKKFLYKKTNNDGYEFESVYKTALYDEVRKLNSNPQLDIDGFREAIDKLNNLDPQVKEALTALNPDNLNAMREAVDNERNNNK